MKVKQIISKSKNGNQMEVVAREGETLKTLHVHLVNEIWKYFAGYERDTKIFLPITL